MLRLGQNINFTAAHAIGITAGGLAQLGSQTAKVLVVGVNGGYAGYRAALAGIAHGYGAPTAAVKTLYRYRPISLYPKIHTYSLNAHTLKWQGGLHDA